MPALPEAGFSESQKPDYFEKPGFFWRGS